MNGEVLAGDSSHLQRNLLTMLFAGVTALSTLRRPASAPLCRVLRQDCHDAAAVLRRAGQGAAQHGTRIAEPTPPGLVWVSDTRAGKSGN